MKQIGKKSEVPRQSLRLEAHDGYRHAASKLDELKKQIPAHKVEQNRLEIQLSRASNAARQYATRGVRLFRTLDLNEWDAVLRKVITQGMVDQRLLREVCADTPKPQVDDWDLKTIRALDDEKASIEMLKGAIDLQEKEVRTQKKLAVEQLCASLNADRQPTIQRLAKAIIALGEAIAEEQTLEAYLADAEPDLVAAIKPRIFPNVLANSEVLDFVAQCINAGLLNDEQIQSLDEAITVQRTVGA